MSTIFSDIYNSKLMEMADKRLENKLHKLDKELSKNNISYCFIGGIAVKEYGFNRNTEDIDILVDKKDESKLFNIFKKYSGSFVFEDESVDVLFSGERVTNSGLNFPKPQTIVEYVDGLPFISLETLIELKIDSGINGRRLKDFGDVQELIKANKLPRDFANNFKDYIRNKYIRIWEDTY